MEIANELLRELHDCWDGKRAGRAMASRSDIDPLDIPRILPNLLLFDVQAESRRFKARLVGTAIVDLYGADYTGRYLDEIELGGGREQILKDYETCLELRRPAISNGLFWNLRDAQLRIERLILPLSDDQEEANMLLAGIAFMQR